MKAESKEPTTVVTVDGQTVVTVLKVTLPVQEVEVLLVSSLATGRLVSLS